MALADYNTLEEAKTHPETIESMIHRDTFNGFLGLAGIYSAMKKIAVTEGHPAQSKIDAFLDSEEYNFMQSSPTGQAQIAALDQLIAANLTVQMGADTVNVSQGLGFLKSTIIARANLVTYPFKNATKHDFELAKGTINRTDVIQRFGVLTITVTQDCEKHNPRVYEYIQNEEFYRPITQVRNVEKTGVYKVEVPQVGNLVIDDAYNVITQPS